MVFSLSNRQSCTTASSCTTLSSQSTVSKSGLPKTESKEKLFVVLKHSLPRELSEPFKSDSKEPSGALPRKKLKVETYDVSHDEWPADVFLLKKKDELDETEKNSIDLFLKLYEISDRKNRNEIKGALECSVEYNSPPPRKYPSTYSSNSSWILEDPEENSFLNKDLVSPSQSVSIVRDVANILADFFFGCGVIKKEDEKSDADLELAFKDASRQWKVLKSKYREPFHIKMDSVFKHADQLVLQRQRCQQALRKYRFSLYLGLSTSLFSAFFDHKIVVGAGLAYFCISCVVMIKKYMDFSFSLMDMGGDLKVEIEQAYVLANGCRLN
ncbi:MAG: hypothetical protein ACH350_05485 [Parachlamydiaceae bacterium]